MFQILSFKEFTPSSISVLKLSTKLLDSLCFNSSLFNIFSQILESISNNKSILKLTLSSNHFNKDFFSSFEILSQNKETIIFLLSLL